MEGSVVSAGRPGVWLVVCMVMVASATLSSRGV